MRPGASSQTHRGGRHPVTFRKLPPARAIERLRRLCIALPGAEEKLSHGEPTWFARRVFVMLSNHHHDDPLGFWFAAQPGEQEALVQSSPERFFRPPYVGGRGWIG